MPETAHRRGRPRADHLDLVERIAPILADDPGIPANEVHRQVGGRKTDVLRCVRALRAVLRSNTVTRAR